jgi:AbrB family looped-hinge helix DNA binding protein
MNVCYTRYTCIEERDMKPPEGKKFYGAVTVSERGQIVIPTDARKDFGIKTGDKLLILGDLEMGLWIATFDIMGRMPGAAELFREIASTMKHKEDKEG